MLILCALLVVNFGIISQGVPSRIVGGHDAPNHKYPYQVSLRHLNGKHFCSGSILKSHWILTAAHCINEIDKTNYTVSVGTNYLNEPGDKYSVLFHTVHENYKNIRYHDIALIRVTEEIDFNDSVAAVELAKINLSNYTLRVEIAGWGSTEYGRPMSNDLQEVELKFISPEECQVWYEEVTCDHLCTFDKIGKGICKGDSGGPLVVEGIQVGIVSYMIPCAVGAPDVYTRVWSYRDWIVSTMNKFDHDIQ